MSTGNKELDRNVKTFKKYRNLLKKLRTTTLWSVSLEI